MRSSIIIVLANSTKICYTYDNLDRVTARTIKNISDNSVIATETYAYGAAGNIVGGSANTTFAYDTNNRLTVFNGNSISYDDEIVDGTKNVAATVTNGIVDVGTKKKRWCCVSLEPDILISSPYTKH